MALQVALASIDTQRGRQFTAANGEYFTIADNASLSASDIHLWVAGSMYFDTLPAFAGIAGKWTAAGNQREYLVYYHGGLNRLVFTVSPDGTGATTDLTAASFGAVSTGVFIHYIAWHDPTTNTINIKVNNGATDSIAHTTGIFDSTSAFFIGNDGGGSFFNGRIGPTGFWKPSAAPTAAEATALYNNGVPLRSGQLAAAGITTPTSYWNMDESSGDAIDSVGSNNLTDTNTVTSVTSDFDYGVCSLHDSTKYGVRYDTGLGAPVNRRIFSPRWKYGYDELVGVSPGNRTAELGIRIRGTSQDDWITNYNALVDILADAERYRTTGGESGRAGKLTVQLTGQTNAVVYDVLGGELDAHDPFQYPMMPTVPIYPEATLRLIMMPYARTLAVTSTTSGTITEGGGTAGGNLVGTYKLAAPAGQFDAPLRLSYQFASGDFASALILGRRTRGNLENFIWCFECDTGTYTGYTTAAAETGLTAANDVQATMHAGNARKISNIANLSDREQLTFTLTSNTQDFFGTFAVFLRFSGSSGPYPKVMQLTYGGTAGLTVVLPQLPLTGHHGGALYYLGNMVIPDFHIGPQDTLSDYKFVVHIGGYTGSNDFWSATGAATVWADCVYLIPIDEPGFMNMHWVNNVVSQGQMIFDDVSPRPWVGVLNASGIVQSNRPLAPFSRTHLRVIPGVDNLWCPLTTTGAALENNRVFPAHDLTAQFTLNFEYHPRYWGWR